MTTQLQLINVIIIILLKLEFSRQIFKKTEKYLISKFTKIRPVESKSFHAEGRTDLAKLMVAFIRIVAKATKEL